MRTRGTLSTSSKAATPAGEAAAARRLGAQAPWQGRGVRASSTDCQLTAASRALAGLDVCSAAPVPTAWPRPGLGQLAQRTSHRLAHPRAVARDLGIAHHT
jgi:hypothetical protein